MSIPKKLSKLENLSILKTNFGWADGLGIRDTIFLFVKVNDLKGNYSTLSNWGRADHIKKDTTSVLWFLYIQNVPLNMYDWN